eukprot:gene17661-12546_t
MDPPPVMFALAPKSASLHWPSIISSTFPGGWDTT